MQNPWHQEFGATKNENKVHYVRDVTQGEDTQEAERLP